MLILKADQVTKTFGEYTAVNRLSFEVNEGEIYGLLGANGAGKTTTMRMVLGIIAPDGGVLRWRGEGYSKDLIKTLGYLPEERGLYPKIKVSEQIIYLAQLHGLSRRDADEALRKWLERFEIGDYYGKRVEELSKGNQQKVQFIAAIIHRPQLLILDEVFSGLDPVNVELVKGVVKELRDQGTAILFSTHRMEHVEELCENISILHKSNVVLQGSLRQIKESFPKERVLLQTERPISGLEGISGVRSVVQREDGYDVFIERMETAQLVLQHAITQSAILRFQVMEPTLNEIFIKSVGDHHE